MTVKKRVTTEKAPAAIGPYSQAIRTGEFLFCSGQIAIDPATGKLIEGDIRAQTERVLKNLQAVVEAGGATLGSGVKTTVYLRDLAEFKEFNEVYGKFFQNAPPASATVQAAALPLGAKVEIDAVALVVATI